MVKKTEKAEQMYLVTWSGNWADEIDFIGRSVMSESQVKQFKKDLKGNDTSFTLYYGTNEDDFMTFDDYYAGCSFEEIPPEAVKFVEKIFDDDWLNWNPDQVWELVNDEDEDEDEDDEDVESDNADDE